MMTQPRPTRYFRAEPVSEVLTRAELVERLRLLWQEKSGQSDGQVVADALTLVIEAFGLTAERSEIFGDDVIRSTF